MQNVDSIIDVPCLRCMVHNRIKQYLCDVEGCSKLETWLRTLPTPHEAVVITTVLCPSCHSDKIVKNGWYRYKGIEKQKFKCMNCGTRFRKGEQIPKFKTPTGIIEYALTLNAQNKYSLRDISKLIKERFSKYISHVTVARWIHNDMLQERFRSRT